MNSYWTNILSVVISLNNINLIFRYSYFICELFIDICTNMHLSLYEKYH